MSGLSPPGSWCLLTLALLGLSLLPPLPVQAQEGVTVGGHLKSLNVHFEAPPAGGIDNGEVSSNSLRLDLEGKSITDPRVELSLDNRLLYTNPPGLVPLPSDSPNRILDMEKNWRDNERFADQLVIDRLGLHGSFKQIDWGVGRQAIGFGRIALFSPMDVIAPFAPDALDSDVRPGVDALRAVRYFGLGGQIGGTVVFGDSPRNNSYLLTFTDNRAGIDLLAIGGRLRDRPMAGFGLAGDVGGVGLKGEVVHYQGKQVAAGGGDLHDSFAIGAVEIWYRFENELTLLLEYLYNGAGAGDPRRYLEAASAASHREGLGFLLGRHYLLAGPSYQLHPLAILSGLLIWNLEDGSLLLRTLLDLSLTDSLALQLFYTFNDGESPTAGPLPGSVVPGSEFGLAGDSGGLFLKYFF